MRLIDADKLMQKLTRAAAAAPSLALKEAVELIIQTIEKEPTAYDVEKVLGALEEAENNAAMRTGNWEDDDPYYDGEVIAYRHAMDLARRGATP